MNNIKRYRLEKGLTLKELSELSNLSSGYLCHLEKGTRCNPSYNTIKKLSIALKIDIHELLY